MSKNIWFTSDCHFYHKNIIEYCNRPFNCVNEMNNNIIDNFNKIVKRNDDVYFLGDLSFYKNNIKNILDLLNTKLFFIYGNHDHDYKNQITPYVKCYEAFKEVKINNIRIVLCHYALMVWNKSHHNTKEKYVSIQLHGHSHGNLETNNLFQLDVGIDNIYKLFGTYRPINFDEINQIIQNRI